MGNALSARAVRDKIELKRLQASISSRNAALMAGGKDFLNTTQNPNLTVQHQTDFNPYVQPFAPTLAFTAFQNWLMPGYTAPHQAPLL